MSVRSASVTQLRGHRPSMTTAGGDLMAGPGDAKRTPAELPGSWEKLVELHPVDFEWYFSRNTTREIVDGLQHHEQVLLFGAPTVAHTMLMDGRREVALVDASPTLTVRFPELTTLKTFAQVDVRSFSAEQRFDVAFFDPPWYLADTMQWLTRAAQLLRHGGLIQFVLFPEAVRPAALEERKRILELAAHLGTVEVDTGAVDYPTPIFEQSALRASGQNARAAFRRGDLVTVSGVLPDRARLSNQSGPAPRQWSTWLIGTQVVKVRKYATTGDADAELSSISGCPGDVLPSVSRRDTRRMQTGLWTSRNRVAKVHDPFKMAAAVQHIAQAPDRANLEDRSGADVDLAHLDRLAELLDIQ